MIAEGDDRQRQGDEDRPVRRRRQVDVMVGVRLLLGEDLLGGGDLAEVVLVAFADVLVLAVEELVERVHLGDGVEVVLLRRVRGHPLQRAGVPRIERRRRRLAVGVR